MDMTLNYLLDTIRPTRIVGAGDREVKRVVCDSRGVEPGDLFVAVKGVAVDAHRFIPDVVDRGATVVVCEELPSSLNEDVTYVVVDDSASALGHIASQYYGNPSSKLKLVGVTGTNGKTTIATLLYELARLLGYKAGLLSTVCNYVDNRPVAATQTTPAPLTIQQLLAEMVEAGCDYAFMEVSSHAAHQRRIDGLTFAGGIFTNLTRDHLDYHGTVDEYLRAKKRFFDLLPEQAFALTNIDDKVGTVMLQNTAAARRSYSLRSMADYCGRIVESRLDGTTMAFNGHEVETLFCGKFNAYNLTAVYGAGSLLGFDPDELLVAMSKLVPVAGRFQTFVSGRGVYGIVDYAHTPDALVNVLDTIRDILRRAGGRIITVVGCGGNRDRGKRPIMAREAAQRSDRLVVTSDNPRNERPDDIIDEMRAGLDTPQLRARALFITDRREAIRTAVALAEPGDVVLVAGKGHETYQEINGVKHHFDDREELQRCFDENNQQ